MKLKRPFWEKAWKITNETVNDQYTTGVFRGDAKETIDNINHPSTDKTMNGVDFVKNRIQQIELSGGGFVNRKEYELSIPEENGLLEFL